MDLTQIEVCKAEGGGWVGAHKTGDDGFQETLAEVVGEQAADGRDQGSARVGGTTWLWRFTRAALAKREASARATIAAKVKAERKKVTGALEWLQGDEGQVLLRVAGWSGIGARGVVEMVVGGKAGAKV